MGGEARDPIPDAEALVCAMALSPGVYSRNRMFGLFDEPRVRAARSRARFVRSVARELAGRAGAVSDVRLEELDSGRVRVRFRIPRLAATREVELTALERALLVYLSEAMGARVLHPVGDEKERVTGALARLAGPLRADAGRIDTR
jgi:hypothetical protein